PSKFEYFMDYLRILDDNFKFSSIKDYEWNITDPELSKELNHPMVNTTIYPSNELCNIINLIALMDIYDKEKFKILDSSTLFTSMLKVHLFSLYTNKGLSATRESEHNLDGLYFFYDKLIDNEYSEDEMKKMLASIKEVIPLIPDIRDNFIIQYDFTKRLYDFSFSEFPVIANTLKLFLGNPYSELEKMMGEFKEGKFKEASSHFNKHQLLLIFVTPEMTSFNSTYNDNIDVNSRLALFQAYLEDRLGKEITAIDPFDGQPVRSTINDGKKTFYCLGHDGKDEKGLGNNITNCDSELKIQIKKYKDREDEKRKNANK
ncbi:MAG: hypothetical protein J6Z11_09960, partial [Candidatus Riflebacteria bacterium]|nr:hypothetical protein [Candidatus Riflebacteria bacterium]